MFVLLHRLAERPLVGVIDGIDAGRFEAARLGNVSGDIHCEIALARFSISRQRLMIHENGSGSRRNSLSSTIFA